MGSIYLLCSSLQSTVATRTTASVSFYITTQQEMYDVCFTSSAAAWLTLERSVSLFSTFKSKQFEGGALGLMQELLVIYEIVVVNWHIKVIYKNWSHSNLLHVQYNNFLSDRPLSC